MNYPLFLAHRLSLSSGLKQKAPAVTVAISAVALSVAVMIASICIVLGFKKEIIDKVVGFNSHISIYASPANPDDENVITLTPKLKDEIFSLPFITECNLQVAIPAIFKTSEDFKGIYLKALSDGVTSRFLKKNLIKGNIPDFSNDSNKNKIVISDIASRQLGITAGDKIETYFISDDIRVRKLEVSAVYNSHFDKYDDVFAFGSLPLIQQLGQINSDQGTYLQIQTDNFDKIEEYTYLLQSHLNKALDDGKINQLYRSENVLSQGAGFFSWLALLDTNVVVILTLMMIVGSITLISGMLIIIIEKKKFIGILKSLGAPTAKVRQVFIWLSIKIAIIGIGIGNIVIIIFLLAQYNYHFMPLDPESYYIDFVPVYISWSNIIMLNLGVIIVIYLVLILPSRFVAGISPAETMRSQD